MPARRTKGRRKAAYLMADWGEYLALGIDMFSDLERAGIIVAWEHPDRDIARSAWLALRDKMLEKYGPDTWAEQEFGAP